MITLRFQTRREDVLEFSRQYYALSPTYRRTRNRVRLMLPVMMLCFWTFSVSRSGFDWAPTIFFFGFSLLWFFFYPARYDRSVRKYCEKLIDEGAYKKNFGACELTLSDDGLRSVSPSGESTYHWSAVDRTLLTDDYLFIFLNDPTGFPIPIADVGRDAAVEACEFVDERIGSGRQ